MTATAKKAPPTANRAPAARATPPAAAANPGPPAPARRRGYTPLTPMRAQTAGSIRRLAGHVQKTHPDLTVHQHLRDAARVLEAGSEEGAQRHLRAAMFALTPQSLTRNGQLTDDAHIAARAAMHGVHRHLLLVKDIADAGERNRAAIARQAAEDAASSPLPPRPPVRPDPDAGYGPGALAQKPVQRQPGGNRALNAPDRTNSGGPDPAAADPQGGQPRGSGQFAYGWDDLAAVIDLSLLHHFDPAQARGRDGKWIGAGEPAAAAGGGRKDPRSITAVGGGRKDWQDLGSQPPDRQVRRDFPDVARRERLITPLRTMQAQMDDIRISSGRKPLHPELAEAFPGVYAKAGIKWDGVSRLPVPKQPRARPDPVRVSGLTDPRADYLKAALGAAIGASNLAAAVELSARTAQLEVTPAPRGRPGGPGLYDVKNLQHTPYFQNLVKALIRRGMPPGKAYPVAYGALRRWARGGGHVHPEVRAAAAGALAGEKAAGMIAKTVHGHAVTWDDVAAVVELVGPKGYIHGWHYVGGPGLPSPAEHETALRGKGGQMPGVKRVPKDGNITGDGDEIRDAGFGTTHVFRRGALVGTVYPMGSGSEYGSKDFWNKLGRHQSQADAIRHVLSQSPQHPGALNQGDFYRPRPVTGDRATGTHPLYGKVTGRVTGVHKDGSTVIKAESSEGGTLRVTPGARVAVGKPVKVHQYAVTWDDLAGVVELAAAAEARVPAGQAGGGQFTKGNSSGQAAARPAAEQAGASKAGAAAAKAKLIAQAASDRAKAAAIARQIAVLRKELASASGTTSSGQSGSTTSSGSSTTASNATTSTSSSSSSASSTSSSSSPSSSQIQAQITTLTGQYNALMKQASQLTAQAGKTA